MSHPVFQHHCIRCLGAVASCRWCSLCPGAVSPIVSVLFICGLGVAASVVLALLHLWCLGALVCCALGLLRPLFRCWCPGAVAAVVLVRWCSWHSGAGVSVAPWHRFIPVVLVHPGIVGWSGCCWTGCVLDTSVHPGAVVTVAGGCVSVFWGLCWCVLTLLRPLCFCCWAGLFRLWSGVVHLCPGSVLGLSPVWGAVLPVVLVAVALDWLSCGSPWRPLLPPGAVGLVSSCGCVSFRVCLCLWVRRLRPWPVCVVWGV